MSGVKLPASWATVEIGEVAEVSGGIQKQQKRRPVRNYRPFLRVANVGRSSLNLDEVHDIELFDGELERYRLAEGDLLVVEGNGSPDQIGRAAMWRGAIADAVHQNHLIRVRPKECVSWRFLELAWNAPVVAKQLKRVAQSTSGLYTLSTSKIKRVCIPLPPLAEQHRIVEALEDHLSRLDAAVQLIGTAVTRSRCLTERVSAITYGHRGPSNVPSAPRLPPAGTDDGMLQDIPPAWSWRRLGDIADVVGGVTKDKKKQSDPALPEVPYLRVANVQRGRLDLSNVSLIRVPEGKALQLALRSGDVLLNEGGDRDKLGRGWIWEEQIPQAIHQNHVFRARIRDNALHPKLLSWYANSATRWFESNGKQSVNLASISLSKIKQLPVPVPPLAEQEAIVERIEGQLSLLDNANSLSARALAKAAALRRSLLHRAFTGRLVPQDPDDEPASVLLDRIRAERGAQSVKPQRKRRARARVSGSVGPSPAPEAKPIPADAVQQELPL